MIGYFLRIAISGCIAIIMVKVSAAEAGGMWLPPAEGCALMAWRDRGEKI
jgi:hypothetical protein